MHYLACLVQLATEAGLVQAVSSASSQCPPERECSLQRDVRLVVEWNDHLHLSEIECTPCGL